MCEKLHGGVVGPGDSGRYQGLTRCSDESNKLQKIHSFWDTWLIENRGSSCWWFLVSHFHFQHHENQNRILKSMFGAWDFWTESMNRDYGRDPTRNGSRVIVCWGYDPICYLDSLDIWAMTNIFRFCVTESERSWDMGKVKMIICQVQSVINLSDDWEAQIIF